jgi:EAL domain-containing protein (putative c-di-GMP-specific phosphodiesterase class I)
MGRRGTSTVSQHAAPAGQSRHAGDILSLLRHDPDMARRGQHGAWTAQYGALSLRSAFQPVMSVTHARIIGYEALVRCEENGAELAPEALLARAGAAGDAVLVDRLTRALHLANFAAQHIEQGWLFLNVLPQLFENDDAGQPFIDELIQQLGIAPERIVLEMLERPTANEAGLGQAVDTMRKRGFLIAIDDFGTGFSNFDRVWQLQPDIVKLDRSLVSRVGRSGSDDRLISQLVSILHQAGTLVLAEGVETDAEVVALMQADVDFVQGFWLATPHASIEAAKAAALPVNAAWDLYERHLARWIGTPGIGFERFERALLNAARSFVAHADAQRAATHVFRVPGARRVFLVDGQGIQHTESLVAPSVTRRLACGDHDEAARERRLAPMFPDAGSNWSRRAYFRRAIASPGRVAVMGPHFSLTDGKDCYAAAVAFLYDGQMQVLCADFGPPDAKAGPIQAGPIPALPGSVRTG